MGPPAPDGRAGRVGGRRPLRLVGQHDDEATKVVFNPAGGRAQALSVGRDGRARLFRRAARVGERHPAAGPRGAGWWTRRSARTAAGS